jgi:hypothetical protein
LDGAKKVNGRKRHLLVDTLGLVCKAHVTPPISATVTARPGCCAAWTGGGFPACGTAGWTRATAASSWRRSSRPSG